MDFKNVLIIYLKFKIYGPQGGRSQLMLKNHKKVLDVYRGPKICENIHDFRTSKNLKEFFTRFKI